MSSKNLKKLSPITYGQDFWHEPINNSLQQLDTDLYDDSLVTLKNDFMNKIDIDIERPTTPSYIEIKGRTLCNLLGRRGSGYNTLLNHGGVNVKIDFDGEDIIVSREIEESKADNVQTYFNTHISITEGKYYLFIFEFSALSEVVNEYFPKAGIQYQQSIFDIVDVEKGISVFICQGNNYESKYAHIETCVKPEFIDYTGELVRVRRCRLYEIPEIEAISTTEDNWMELVQKYPYVDDVKPIVNPYILNKKSCLVTDRFTPGFTFLYDACQYSSALHIATVLGRHHVENNTNYTIILNKPIGLSAVNLAYKFFTNDNEGVFQIHVEDLIDKQVIHCDNSLNGDIINIALVAHNTKQFSNAQLEQIASLRILVIPTELYTNNNMDYSNSEITFETTLYEDEVLYKDVDGSYVKNKIWEEITIDENNTEVITVTELEGYHGKVIKLRTGIHPTLTQVYEDTNGYLISFDSSIHKNTNIEDINWKIIPDLWLNMLNIELKIPNELSGWGDGYIPTNEEASSFLSGWKMQDKSTRDKYDNNSDPDNKIWGCIYAGEGILDEYGCNGVYTDKPDRCNLNYAVKPIRLIFKNHKGQKVKVHTIGSLVLDNIGNIEIGSGRMYNTKFIQQTDRRMMYHGGHKGYDYYKSNQGYRVDYLTIAFDETMNILPISSRPSNSIQVKLLGRTIFNNHYIVKRPNDIYCNFELFDYDTISNFESIIKYPVTISGIINNLISEINSQNIMINNSSSIVKNNISRIIPNPNLLINGDFRINQRGLNSYPCEGDGTFTVDRMISLGNGSSIVKPSENGITIIANEAKYAGIGQIISMTELDLRGQTLTFTVKTNNGTNIKDYTRSDNTSSREYYHDCMIRAYYKDDKNMNIDRFCLGIGRIDTNGVYSITFKVPDNATQLIVYTHIGPCLNKSDFLEIEWMKLEYGDVSTPFVAKSRDVELRDCKRYYQRLNDKIQPDIISKNWAFFTYKFDEPMRIAPTVNVMENVLFQSGNEVVHFPIDSELNVITAESTDRFIRTMASPIDKSVKLSMDKGLLQVSLIELDAEIR